MADAATWAAIAATVGAGSSIYSGKRASDYSANQADVAEAERAKQEKLRKMKDLLRKQGVQEQATKAQTDIPNSETGGIPLSIKKRLTIDDSGANV